jgi:hypothetical protein
MICMIGVPAGMIPSKPSLRKKGISPPKENPSESTTPEVVVKGRSNLFRGCTNKELYPGGTITAQ